MLFAQFGLEMYGSVASTDDSPPTVTIEIPQTKNKENQWAAQMIKTLKKKHKDSPYTNRNRSNPVTNAKRNREFRRNAKKRKTGPALNRPNQPKKERKHEPFKFVVGMDEISEEYNKALSNLAPMTITPYEPPQNNKCSHKGRVFALGIMKTGTTSMTAALNHLGYHCTHDSCIHLGNWFHFIDTVHLWQPFEIIVLSILNMTDLLNETYLKETQQALAFGDSPWCFLYPVWDKLYPDSKYILMTRKDDETYVNSYLRYLKKFGKKFVNKGLSDEEFALIALRRYHLHNERVREYFKDRPDDLLEITVGDSGDIYDKVAKFLGCNKPSRRFPHENKSNRMGIKTKYSNIKVDPNDDKWNWRKKWKDNLPYLVRNDGDQSHSLHVATKDQFILDWNLFVVGDLRVSDPLSAITVAGE